MESINFDDGRAFARNSGFDACQRAVVIEEGGGAFVFVGNGCGEVLTTAHGDTSGLQIIGDFQDAQ